LTIRKPYLHQAIQDPARTHLLLSYLGEILKGIVEDGIPIKGVFAWSSVDNWEWNTGFKGKRPAWLY
jgi:beta-glucosidase